ncbi:hypothetical protein [Diaphorobacter sp. HDW4A]|uniref:hypothetical protein n=1 Tax=Diaphorobacter sp. HDW4A TaxID=2714924 RepID=UPI00353011C7
MNSTGRSPIFGFYGINTGSSFYTIQNGDKDFIINNGSATFSYSGPTYYAYPTNKISGLTPVYRYYNATTGTHFYTGLDSEFASLGTTTPSAAWTYEGVAWYSPVAGTTGTSPVYRFYNKTSGGHYYTISSTERDSIITSKPNMTYDGISFYV